MSDCVEGGKIEDFNHIPGGGNILYMDGHVEFERYPGRFPLTSLGLRIFSLGT